MKNGSNRDTTIHTEIEGVLDGGSPKKGYNNQELGQNERDE